MAVEDRDEWWSVSTMKWGRPARKIWHFLVAQATARSSSSMTAYRYSASDRNLEPAWTMDQMPPCCCWRTKPRPWRLASVHRRVDLVGSKYDSVGADVSDSLTVRNAVSNSSDQMNSFLVLRSGRRGARRLATIAVVEESWLTSPTNDRRSVRLAGVGKLVMAWTMEGSMW